MSLCAIGLAFASSQTDVSRPAKRDSTLLVENEVFLLNNGDDQQSDPQQRQNRTTAAVGTVEAAAGRTNKITADGRQAAQRRKDRHGQFPVPTKALDGQIGH